MSSDAWYEYMAALDCFFADGIELTLTFSPYSPTSTSWGVALDDPEAIEVLDFLFHLLSSFSMNSDVRDSQFHATFID